MLLEFVQGKSGFLKYLAGEGAGFAEPQHEFSRLGIVINKEHFRFGFHCALFVCAHKGSVIVAVTPRCGLLLISS